jgi:phenylacetate-CoA ligase
MPFFDQSVETMPREDLQRLQLEKFLPMLDQLNGRNRFYTNKLKAAGIAPKDIQSLDDLSRFPLTTKAELMAAQADDPPFGTNATFPESAYTRLHQTSGTTGTPLRVLDTRADWDWWGRCWGFVLAGAGLTADDRLFVPFSFGPFIGFWAAIEGSKEIGAMMIPGGGRDSLQRLHLMRELGATAMCCTPTYALRLAEVAREEGFDPDDIPMRITVHAGEPGANVPATKARIEAAWTAKCFDHAGASEVGAHSFECEAQPGGTHVIESEYIAEVLDPQTGEAVPAGETGELVITNLGRIGFPVIRYRSGDLVRLNMKPCDCGRTFARFDGGVLGRADDMVIVRGVNVFPSAVENMVRQFEAVDEFRVTVSTQRKMGELEVELELAEGADAEQTQTDVERAIQNSLGLRPTVTVVSRGSLPRFELKARRFQVAD